jgi:hypothetical protein
MTFKETLKQAAAEVDTWPRWKREALGVVKALNGALALPAEYSAVVDRKFWELIGANKGGEWAVWWDTQW